MISVVHGSQWYYESLIHSSVGGKLTDSTLYLHVYLQKHSEVLPHTTLEISEKDTQFSWVMPLKQMIMNKEKKSVWLVSSGEPSSGILGLVSCLRKEEGGEKIR